jgi:LuxR family transcriptional regulator, regulator of acetate metabolism
VSAARTRRHDSARAASVPGQRELERRLAGLMTDAHDVLGIEFGTAEVRAGALDAADEVIAAVALQALAELRSLRKGDRRATPLCELAVRGADLELDLREHSVQRRTRALAGVESALGRLRCIAGPAELLDSVCTELVRSCGFSRAMLSRVEEAPPSGPGGEGEAGDRATWVPWKAHFGHREVRPSDEEWMASTRIPLDAMILERELLQQRRAALVVDTAGNARALEPFVAATGTASYVAAPVIPAGRVVGFLHADHYPSTRSVDHVDRDILWAFADGFGHIYERIVLLERLNSQRDHVRSTLRNAEAIMDNLARAELELARHQDERSITSDTAALTAAGRQSAMDELLTPREREVLLLIVAGQSNSAIAGRLVISEGTVKSHVKQILRKLGAVNRSEAIARYLGMIGSG